jgi:hypothetical protein
MPSKPSKLVHISFLVDPEVAKRIDDEAKRLTKEDPHQRPYTRTDALRVLLNLALKVRGEERSR